MENKGFRQKSVAGKKTGSLANYLMGNNTIQPKVGEGATILHWKNSNAYEVIEVSEDGLECVIQRYNPERIDTNGTSENQQYKYEKLTKEKMTLVYRKGAWRQLFYYYYFRKEFLNNLPYNYASMLGPLTQEQLDEAYKDNQLLLDITYSSTYKKKTYRKVSVIFGVKREYHDYSL